MKSVLISIQPKWCELIASGKKTVEVRKTKPKLDPPFKCYIYCTNGTEKLWVLSGSERAFSREKIASIAQAKDVGGAYQGNGKVIGEFVCRNIDYLHVSHLVLEQDAEIALKGTCLTKKEVWKYIGYEQGKNIWEKPYEFFGWHISELVIYDQPRDVTGFYHYCGDDPKCDGCELLYYSNTECGKEEFCCSNMYGCKPLKRPPQSWCYVEEGGAE
jgi:predicted transcriptional regulator